MLKTKFYFLLMLYVHHWPDGLGEVFSSLWDSAGGAAALWNIDGNCGKRDKRTHRLLKLLAGNVVCHFCSEPQFPLKGLPGWSLPG